MDDDFDYEEMDDEDPIGRRRGRGRRILGRSGKKKKEKQKSPWAQDPFLQVKEPGARNMFRKVSRRMDGIDERLGALEDEFRAEQASRARPIRDNPRFAQRYDGRDFGPGNDYDLGGRGNRRPSGGMGNRRPGIPYRNQPYGRGMEPRDEFGGFGMDMGLGDDDGKCWSMVNNNVWAAANVDGASGADEYGF